MAAMAALTTATQVFNPSARPSTVPTTPDNQQSRHHASEAGSDPTLSFTDVYRGCNADRDTVWVARTGRRIECPLDMSGNPP